MADKSPIEWTDATYNPITGCTLVDEGCRHCYAAHLITSWPAIGNHLSRKGLARKNANGESKFTGEVRFNAQWLDQPLRWRKPRKIFVCAHGDLFHPAVPDDWIDQVFAVMALAPQHIFQVLTKRPERAREYLESSFEPGGAFERMSMHMMFSHPGVPSVRETCEAHGIPWTMPTCAEDWWPLKSVWLMTSISDQASANLRIPELLACPAAVHGVSAEPLLGPVNLSPWLHSDPDCAMEQRVNPACACWCGGKNTYTPRLDWVIVGGESGPHARPMHSDWARQIRDQCVAADVPYFHKQNGEYQVASHENGHFDSDMSTNKAVWVDFANGTTHKPYCTDLTNPIAMIRIGKKAAGRLLDGRTWDQMPGVPV